MTEITHIYIGPELCERFGVPYFAALQRPHVLDTARLLAAGHAQFDHDQSARLDLLGPWTVLLKASEQGPGWFHACGLPEVSA